MLFLELSLKDTRLNVALVVEKTPSERIVFPLYPVVFAFAVDDVKRAGTHTLGVALFVGGWAERSDHFALRDVDQLIEQHLVLAVDVHIAFWAKGVRDKAKAWMAYH